VAEIEKTYASFNGNPEEILRYRRKLEQNAIRMAAKERKAMMNEALARDPQFQSGTQTEQGPSVALFSGGILRVGPSQPATRASPQTASQPPRYPPQPPDEDFSSLDPELREAMEKFKQMERDEALVASLSLPANLHRDSEGPRMTGTGPTPSGRPSYSPLRLPAPAKGEGPPPPKIKLTGASSIPPAQGKPSSIPSAVAAPQAPEKKSWFKWGKK
jgi:hypothetical protein